MTLNFSSHQSRLKGSRKQTTGPGCSKCSLHLGSYRPTGPQTLTLSTKTTLREILPETEVGHGD